eukprot:UN07465
MTPSNTYWMLTDITDILIQSIDNPISLLQRYPHGFFGNTSNIKPCSDSDQGLQTLGTLGNTSLNDNSLLFPSLYPKSKQHYLFSIEKNANHNKNNNSLTNNYLSSLYRS